MQLRVDCIKGHETISLTEDGTKYQVDGKPVKCKGMYYDLYYKDEKGKKHVVYNLVAHQPVYIHY